MADEWETAKHCERCELYNKRVYCKGQFWGNDPKGFPEFKITCASCGWTMISDKTWNGH